MKRLTSLIISVFFCTLWAEGFGSFPFLFGTCLYADKVSNTPIQTQSEHWLFQLHQRIADDAIAGNPIVIQTHVALCDNRIIQCGAQGDGDNIQRNLYWTTSEGFVGWLKAQKEHWTLVLKNSVPMKDVLEIRVYEGRIVNLDFWKKYGVKKPIIVYLVAYAWRGVSIDKAWLAYMKDLYQTLERPIKLPDGTTIKAGGKAHVVAWVGHNHLMDDDRSLSLFSTHHVDSKSLPKGMMVMSCLSGPYMASQVSAASRVPLLLTNDFVFASAPAIEAATRSLLKGENLKQIREKALEAYAASEKKSIVPLRNVIVNPSHPKWKW